ncbi:MAG TPA: hypothetical protein VID27_06420 [Blastocatellia bacterium]|jgi:hypothetical protein
MRDRRKLSARVDAIVKQNDSEVMIQRTFYDEASDRLFITLIRGSHRVNLTLAARDLDNGDRSKAEQVIRDNIAHLDQVPIG